MNSSTINNTSNKFQNATPDGGSHTSTDVWITPQWIIDAIGVSDLDPCGWLPSGVPIVKTAINYFTEERDGLIQDWSAYRSVFVNFPYSKSYEWMTKCAAESKRGCEIIVLCFVRSETKAWQHNVKSATGINLMNKRVKFLDSEGVEHGNGNCPRCLIAWGADAFQRIQKIDGIYLRINT